MYYKIKSALNFIELTLTFLLMYISDIPAPPTNFNFEVNPDDSRSITVTWTESLKTGPVDEVDEYVVEKSINGDQFQLVYTCISTCMHKIT